jgi:hypothetical protein
MPGYGHRDPINTNVYDQQKRHLWSYGVTHLLLNLSLIGVGIVLVILRARSHGRSGDRIAINQGFSVFGFVTQSITNLRLERAPTPHDWFGWSLSGAGLLVGIWGLLKL